jgi:peptidoglycan-associated lipoprotein
MTGYSRTAYWLLATMVALASGCSPKPVPVVTPPDLSPRDLVVLAADPETGAVGEVSVSTPQGTVALTLAGEGTDVRSGQAPAPPALRPAEDVQRIFGDALGAMAPAALRYTLYFGLNSTTLDDESRARLSQIADAVRSRVAAEVSVVGHTDTTGPAPANVPVALRRATAVKELLVAQGVDERLIVVGSHGESNPAVPTPDNTDEPRNRRVEVTVR